MKAKKTRRVYCERCEERTDHKVGDNVRIHPRGGIEYRDGECPVCHGTTELINFVSVPRNQVPFESKG